MKNLEHACNRIIEFAFYALFFLVPLAMTPFNFELFEFNKMLVVYALTAVITGAWLIRMVLAKKIIFRRSFWDIPLTIFLITQILSYFFSIDRQTSFWGYYSRFNGGLLSVISYLLLYWAYVANINSRITYYVLRITLASAAIVAGYGILEHFGIDAQYWVQDVRNRVFSTLGQPNWLAAWLVVLLPLSLALGLSVIREMRDEKQNRKNYVLRITSYVSLFIAFCLCLFYTRSRSGLMAAGLTLAIFFFLKLLPQMIAFKKKSSVLFTALVVILAIASFGGKLFWDRNEQDVRYILGLANQVQITPQKTNEGGSESADIRKVVWKGAVDIWRHHPVFGTGPETFAYSYYWYRPREHNDLSEWDFLYNKAHNEYLNYAATTGVLGLGSYLLLIGSFIFWGLKRIFNLQFSNLQSISNDSISKRPKQKKIENLNIENSLEIENWKIKNLTMALFAGFAGIAITNFFGFAVVPVSLLFFLFPASAVALRDSSFLTDISNSIRYTKNEIRETTKNPKVSVGQRLTIGLIFLITCYVLRITLNYWYADTQFAKAEKLGKAGQYNLAYNTAGTAVDLRPSEPGYHDELGLDLAGLAGLAQKENNATLSAQLARPDSVPARLAKMAVEQSTQALKISPFNLNFWKNRVKIFYRLGEIDGQYHQQALATLLQAEQLAPTDPKIKYNLGLLYAQFGQTETAIKTLEDTVALKPNYPDVRYALSLFYDQVGRKNEARQQLEEILKIDPQNQKIKDMLEKR